MRWENLASFCGDIFLEDVRRYREERLTWQRPDGSVSAVAPRQPRTRPSFIDLGFRAVLCCLNTRVLDARSPAASFDESLLADFPETIDPCGENGEFHTFVFAGPNFAQPYVVHAWRIHAARGHMVIAICSLPK